LIPTASSYPQIRASEFRLFKADFYFVATGAHHYLKNYIFVKIKSNGREFRHSLSLYSLHVNA
jgi:hypothetical protein